MLEFLTETGNMPFSVALALMIGMISILALLFGLLIVRVFGALHKIIPPDESDAITEESLIGRIATITLGSASHGNPAEAKVRDIHGTTHYVMVEPDAKGKTFTSSHSILLVRKNGATFKAIENTNPALIDQDN